jgi:hypothetical protein
MTIIANEPTTSRTTVSSKPAHLPDSLPKMYVNTSGARVPVQPAVKTPMNWAVKIESANGRLKVPIANAIVPVIAPIPRPTIKRVNTRWKAKDMRH